MEWVPTDQSGTLGSGGQRWRVSLSALIWHAMQRSWPSLWRTVLCVRRATSSFLQSSCCFRAFRSVMRLPLSLLPPQLDVGTLRHLWLSLPTAPPLSARWQYRRDEGSPFLTARIA